MITLKQFRSAAYPDYACYQSIIQQGLNYDPPKIQGEIGGPIDVSIYRYPDQPIVKILGLKVERTEIRGGVAVDHLQPVRPGWLRTAMTQELGKTLCWRANTEQWTQGWIPDPSYFKGDGLHRSERDGVRESKGEPKLASKPKAPRRRRPSQSL